MFSSREVATMLAALLFWREENAPHGPEVTRPYLAHFGLSEIEPLSVDEIERLCQRLRQLISPESGGDASESG